MQSRTVGFVGGGRITAIFLQALGGRGLSLERVTVSDTSTEVLAGLKTRFPDITTTADNKRAAACERVFLALHPPALKAVLPEIAPSVRKDAVVVSLAPVLRIAKLTELRAAIRSELAAMWKAATFTPDAVKAALNHRSHASG